MFRGRRTVDTCTNPMPIEFDGHNFNTVISHFPITWILCFSPRDWENHPDDIRPDLRVDAPDIPPE